MQFIFNINNEFAIICSLAKIIHTQKYPKKIKNNKTTINISWPLIKLDDCINYTSSR